MDRVLRKVSDDVVEESNGIKARLLCRDTVFILTQDPTFDCDFCSFSQGELL
eukprot:m.364963 g.364963  ORF g.364963 m.364963 type:complete len:52 (+) comp29190_c0_seq1:251-406(+)